MIKLRNNYYLYSQFAQNWEIEGKEHAPGHIHTQAVRH